MSKKVFFLSFIICASAFMTFGSLFKRRQQAAAPLLEQSKVMEAFQSLGPEAGECCLEATGLWEDGGSYLERQKLLEQMAADLGIHENYSFNISSSPGRERTDLQMDGKNALTQLSVITDTESLENYIIIRIDFPQLTESALYYRSKVLLLMDDYKIRGSVLMDMSGYFAGNLTDQQRDNLAEQFFRAMNAVVLENSSPEGVYTRYGYSRLIPEYLAIEGEPVNLNLAMNYDEIQNRTNIYVGMPLISREY